MEDRWSTQRDNRSADTDSPSLSICGVYDVIFSLKVFPNEQRAEYTRRCKINWPDSLQFHSATTHTGIVIKSHWKMATANWLNFHRAFSALPKALCLLTQKRKTILLGRRDKWSSGWRWSPTNWRKMWECATSQTYTFCELFKTKFSLQTRTSTKLWTSRTSRTQYQIRMFLSSIFHHPFFLNCLKRCSKWQSRRKSWEHLRNKNTVRAVRRWRCLVEKIQANNCTNAVYKQTLLAVSFHK